MFRKNPKISVCIPVYNTEKYLLQCLKSVAEQNFIEKEIIVVNDGSNNNDNKKNNFSSIIKTFKKQFKTKINVINHDENKGLLEARRSAVYAAKGKYILNLDSDDFLEPNALEVLYKAAEKSAISNKENSSIEKTKSSFFENDFFPDIVHGKANVFYRQDEIQCTDSKKLQETFGIKNKTANCVFEGELSGGKILDGFLIEKNHNNFLWGKLILRETYLEAFNHIPQIFCTMQEDFIQYFFIALESKKYIGIKNVVYNYSISSGISSSMQISDLKKWNQVCSTASIFTVLLNEMQEKKKLYTEQQCKAVKNECIFKLKNNFMQLKNAVAKEIKEDAYKMLCEYWGEDFVKEIEKIGK